MSNHAGHSQSSPRWHTAIIIAFVPARVGHNSLTANLIESNLLRRMAHGCRNGYDTTNFFGMRIHPFQRLKAAHGTAGYGEKFCDTKVFDQMYLGANHITNSYNREIQSVGLA